MKAEIQKILFSRNQCSVADVKEMLTQGAIEAGELAAVLGKDVADGVTAEARAPQPEVLSHGGIYAGPDQSNLVVLWGRPSSGKTSIIGSLLSLEGMTAITPQGADSDSQAIRSRVESLARVFGNCDTYQRLPEMPSSPVEVYHARYRKGWRSYDLSLAEASLDGWWDMDRMLKTCYRQIHLFVIDCRQDIDEQVRDHQRVTDLLMRGGYLQQADGVYVLVTKADLMNAPEAYLDNAAQTLVTTSLASDFWHLIRNKCKETYIYNEQPIVCSVGDFVLKDYAKVRQDYARRLCDDFILHKCEHRHWGLVKLLKMGSKGMAVGLSLLAVAVLAFGAFWMLKALDKPPTNALRPFNYAAYFMQEVEQDLQNASDFDAACNAYSRLRQDLDTEHRLRLKGGGAVLPDSTYKRCDASLCNTFGRVVDSKMKKFFDSSGWTSDSAFMSKANRQLAELNRHSRNMDATLADNCRNYQDYISCYRESIKPLASRINNCASLDGVRSIVDDAKRWSGKYPFDHDANLSDMLSSAGYQACSSYTDYLRVQCDNLKEEYENYDSFSRFSDAIGLSDTEDQIKESRDALKDEIDAFFEYLLQENIDRSESFTERLRDMKDTLRSIDL